MTRRNPDGARRDPGPVPPLCFDLSPDQIDQAAARVLAVLSRRAGPPACAGDGWASWLSGALFASLRLGPSWRVVWREGRRCRRLGFERSPLTGAWAQLPPDVAALTVPRLAVGPAGEIVALEEPQLRAVGAAFPSASAAYFASTVDLASVHAAARGGHNRKPCELCGRPVLGGAPYVERYDKQGRDGRRAHQACGLRAWRVATTTTQPAHRATQEVPSWH